MTSSPTESNPQPDHPVTTTSVSFGRTESWHGGWKGKMSSTDVRVNGEAVGIIEGFEDASISGNMHYTVRIWSGVQRNSHRSGIDSMKAAKRHARFVITGRDPDLHGNRAQHGEGKVGGPCHAVKSDGFFCGHSAVMVADGWGYCPQHAPTEG